MEEFLFSCMYLSINNGFQNIEIYPIYPNLLAP